MAVTEYYVDPSIAADSGTGTIGDPFGDLQYALNNVTRDSTNGDRFNIKAGTDEVLSAALDFTAYGTPTFTAPCTFQGYASAAGDGGIGGISGGGSVGIFSSTSIDHLRFIDLHLHSTGSVNVVEVDTRCYFINCEVDNGTGSGLVLNGGEHIVLGCYIHNVGNYGVDAPGVSGTVAYCFFENGANVMAAAVRRTSGAAFGVAHCIFNMSSTSDGVFFDGSTAEDVTVKACTFFTTGTGTGIEWNNSSAGGFMNYVANNLFEGWATGIEFASPSDKLTWCGHNAFFDCGTDIANASTLILGPDNESLGASPFAKSGAATFANRNTYFQPVDTGNVLSPFGGLTGAKGAVQPGILTGGGGAPLIGGGLVQA